MSGHAPYVGFGDPDDAARFAHFGILITGDEDVYPDWESELVSSTRQIAGTSNIVTQVMGHGPGRLTLRVEFMDRATYRQFRRYEGTKQTLSLLAGFTSYEGVIRTHNGTAYERFDETMLLAVTGVQNRIGGGVECTATFQRAGVEGASW